MSIVLLQPKCDIYEETKNDLWKLLDSCSLRFVDFLNAKFCRETCRMMSASQEENFSFALLLDVMFHLTDFTKIRHKS